MILSAAVETPLGASASVKLHLSTGDFVTEAIGLGPIGTLFGSYAISEDGTKRCMVSPGGQEDMLMTDQDRGYPCFLSLEEGDGRRLTSADRSITLASLHAAWRDSDRAHKVVGALDLTPSEGEDLYLPVLLAATVEILRNLQAQGTVISRF